jgi:hypothetical protein
MGVLISIDNQLATAVKYFIHRSGTETLWTCPRKYFLEYLYLQTGVRKTPTKLQLVVGSAVHVGLAVMCTEAKRSLANVLHPKTCAEAIIQAVEYFRRSDTFQHLKEHERFEQQTLIAGLLWAFFYHSWAAFIATYEIVCVERAFVDTWSYGDDLPTFVISSRPDVIVRHRGTNEFIGISWKTIDSLSDYKRWNFRENLQNLMETYYGEKLLSVVLEEEYEFPDFVRRLRGRALVEATEKALDDFRKLPREIAYVQTIFLVKGPRQCELLDGSVITWEDGQFYDEQEKTWRQQSLLCYRYVNGAGVVPVEETPTLEEALVESLKPSARGRKAKIAAPKPKGVQQETSWSYRYWKPGNKSYNNLSGDWLRQPIWESGISVHDWVQTLNAGGVFPSTGAEVCDAYGVLDLRNEVNPLNRVVIWDEPVERNESLMLKTVDDIQTQHYQMVRAGFVLPHDGVDSTAIFDIEAFPRQLSACNNSAPAAGVPVRCEYRDVCYMPVPLIQIEQGGQWVTRQPHHEVERESFRERGLFVGDDPIIDVEE